MAKSLKMAPSTAERLRELLRSAKVARDSLPYTEEFGRLKRESADLVGRAVSDADFWQMLVHVGKRGVGGPRKPRTPAPRLTHDEQMEIQRLSPHGLGARDRLPYTTEFDEIREKFSKFTGRQLSKHDFWRALASLAKRSRKPEPLFDVAPLGDLPRQAVEILEFTNPWWRGDWGPPTPRFRRWAFHEAWKGLHQQITPAVGIRGPRQVGKSTIQQQLIEQLLLGERVSPAQILRVQFDEVPQLGNFRQPILSIVRWYEKYVLKGSINARARRGKPVYLFFDEVQNLKTWAPELKSLVDHAAAKTLVTGSSSLRISRGQDSLAGRIAMIDLGPLRMREIAGFRDLGDLPVVAGASETSPWARRDFWLDASRDLAKSAQVLDAAFDCFSRLGGYPICHKQAEESKSELAARIVDIVVARTIERDLAVDPSGRSWDKNLLRQTFRHVCRYAGQSVKPQKICDDINALYPATATVRKVTDAIQHFTDAMLIHTIEPLEVALRRPRHAPKMCLCDHFIREAWLHESVPLSPRDLRQAGSVVATLAGHLMESVIGYYLKGIPELDVAWFPERPPEREVDFVLTIGLLRIPIEVKYSRRRPTSKDVAALESFCRNKKYNAPFGILVTQETAGKVGDHTVAVPASTLLAVV